jgi:hypothetical protein
MQLKTFYTPTMKQINALILLRDEPKLTPAFVRKIRRSWDKFVKDHPEMKEAEADYWSRYNDLEPADRARAFIDRYNIFDDPYYPAIEHVKQLTHDYGLRGSAARRVCLLLCRSHHGVLYNVARSIEIAWANRNNPGVNFAIYCRFLEFTFTDDDSWLQPSMIEDEIVEEYMVWIAGGDPGPVHSLVYG